ncbi:hypothetical protein ALC62_05339, partial [Cyphomyrmex costatus]
YLVVFQVQGTRWRTSYEREGTCNVPSISTENGGLPLSCTVLPASPRHPNPPPLRESGSSLKRHALADHRVSRCLQTRK